MNGSSGDAAATAGAISGLSHITLLAPSRQLWQKTLQFYNTLGLPTVSLGGRPSSRAESLPGVLANGNGSAEETEAWLHVFAATPESEVSIRLALAQEGTEQPTDEAENYLEKLQERSRALDRNEISTELVTFNFTVVNLHAIQGILRTLDSPNLRVNHNSIDMAEPAHSELFAYDPLGNLLCFSTSSRSPFAKPAKVSAMLSPAVQVPTTVVQQAPRRRKRIGIMTSGGDSSGMNAAVRAVVRISLARGCIPYVIFEGWQGLVEGGNMVKRVGWEDVRGIMSLGGTVIGSARSVEFRKREGRAKAALNMVKAGIDALVVCGGDGSLTGADLLRSEWPSLIEDLLKEERITPAEAEPVKKALTIVGLVGSIDNDMASTDITIGANTSLHRICESLDSIVSTALSHQRAFVVEVMGRHCGWLALMAAISVAADWVFLPERPPPLTQAYEDWETEMCESLGRARKMGNRKTIVIVAEGAIDRDLKPITGEMVKQVLEKKLGLDTRVTTLGHVQRGGTPSAFDRYLGTVQGAKAVDAVLEATPETPSPMIGMSNNQIIKIPLMEAVKRTHEVADAVAKHDFARAMELRDPDFQAAYDAYYMSTIVSENMGSEDLLDDSRRLRVAVMHVGAPAGGMNAATRGFVRVLLNRGHTPLGIFNGFSGLADGNVKVLSWADVIGWTTKGGSELGTNRDQPAPLPTAAGMAIRGKAASSNGVLVDLGLVAYNLQKFNIQALMIIGGFEALTSVMTLYQGRAVYPAFCIPIVHLPATVSNNVPGTEYSIGSDTALNAIVQACDTIKLSAAASRKRVFVVEVQGGNCGYLATLGGLATGATNCYIPEEGVNLDRLQNDVKHLIRRYSEEDELGIPNEGRIIIRNEGVSQSTYTTDVLSSIFHEEGKGLFDSRTATLGHLQQGGVPSPLDRIRAMRMAVSCAEWIEANALASIERRMAELAPASKCATMGTPTRRSTPISSETTATAMTLQSHTAIAAIAAASAAKASTSSFNAPSANLQAVYCPQPETAAVIGIKGANVVFTPAEIIMAETDLTKRKAVDKPWWLDLQHLTRTLAKYGYVEEEAEDVGTIVTEHTEGGRVIRRLAMLRNLRSS